jgi:hypothetical protein
MMHIRQKPWLLSCRICRVPAKNCNRGGKTPAGGTKQQNSQIGGATCTGGHSGGHGMREGPRPRKSVPRRCDTFAATVAKTHDPAIQGLDRRGQSELGRRWPLGRCFFNLRPPGGHSVRYSSYCKVAKK